MKWAEKEVASLELSKKLKELGFPQEEPGWFWYANITNAIYRLIFLKEFDEKTDKDMEDYIKAPTNSELGEWLPIVIEDYGLSIYKTLNGWAIEYEKYNFIEGSKKTLVKIKCDNETEANTRAKMLIFLVENGYITFNQGDNNAQSRQQA